MPLPPATLTLLRRAFSDICKGYSSAAYQGGVIYVKHLGHQQHLGYESTEESFRQEALSKGALSEADRLVYLAKKGLWSEGKEGEIARQRDTLVRFEEAKKSLPVPSMIRRHEEQIKQIKDKLHSLLAARAEVVGITAEVYAMQRLNDHYILTNLYADSALTRPLFTDTVFDDLSDREIEEVVNVYNAATEPCSDANIRLLACQDLFISYYILCRDNLADFFGVPVTQMTYYQVRLGGAARYFKTLIERVDLSRLPAGDRNDPDAIERATNAQRNQSQAAAEGRVSNVGLSRSDIKEMGLEGTIAKTPRVNMNMTQLIEHTRRSQGGVTST